MSTRHPASLFQRFMLHVERSLPGFAMGPWFTLNAVLTVRGPLDPALLRTALDELVRRHELLRTRVLDRAAGPVQVVAQDVPGALEEVGALADAEWDHAPVPADAPSPLLVRFASRGADEHLLSLHLHHVVSDPATLWGVLTELAALYTAAAGLGEPPPPPGAQYGAYAAYELAQAQDSGAWRWWQDAVRDRTFGSVRRAAEGEPFAFRTELLTAAELATATRVARTHRATLLVTLFAALATGMRPHVPDGDLMFLTAFSTRDRPQWQRMLGPCLQTSYLPLPRPPQRPTAEYLHAVRDTLLAAKRHCRFETQEVTAMTPFFADPANIAPFFEYVPDVWPAGVRFGAATAEVLRAPGPKDLGRPTGFGIRSRTNAAGNLAAHVSGGGAGWTAEVAADLCRDLPRQLSALAPEQAAAR